MNFFMTAPLFQIKIIWFILVQKFTIFSLLFVKLGKKFSFPFFFGDEFLRDCFLWRKMLFHWQLFVVDYLEKNRQKLFQLSKIYKTKMKLTFDLVFGEWVFCVCCKKATKVKRWSTDLPKTNDSKKRANIGDKAEFPSPTCYRFCCCRCLRWSGEKLKIVFFSFLMMKKIKRRNSASENVCSILKSNRWREKKPFEVSFFFVAKFSFVPHESLFSMSQTSKWLFKNMSKELGKWKNIWDL